MLAWTVQSAHFRSSWLADIVGVWQAGLSGLGQPLCESRKLKYH
jgi:hypothetical protein